MLPLVLSRRQKIVFGTASLLASATGFALAIFLPRPAKNTSNSLSTPAPVAITTATSEPSINVVLVGHGGPGHPGGTLADAILLVNIIPTSKQLKLISIPRDLWVNLPNGENKINHAFSESPTALKDAIATVTGIRPEYYVSVDFVSFQRAIGKLGKFTVNVPETFDDYFYPIEGQEQNTCGFSPEKMEEVHRLYTGFELEKQFTCRYEHLHFEAGPTQMEGGDALKFVRSRHSGQHGGDFARSERQQALILALKDYALSINALQDIPDLFEEFERFVGTDVNAGILTGMAEIISDPTDYQIKHIYINTDNVLVDGRSNDGQYVLHPKAGPHNWLDVQQFVNSK